MVELRDIDITLEGAILQEIEKYGGKIYKGLSKRNKKAFDGLCHSIGSRLCLRSDYISQTLKRNGF